MKKNLIAIMAILGSMASGSTIMAQQSTQAAVNEKLEAENAQRIEKLEKTVKNFGNLKISGYVQGQWQLAEEKGAPAFADGGSFNKQSDNRFMIRRGRIKFTYTKGIMQAVVQPDFTEKGVGIKDVYMKLSTRSKVLTGTMGVFDRPFGYEISYSSSQRESPERSRVFLSLFPGERDLGVMLTLKGNKGWLSQFTLDAGLFNGNGIGSETDSHKDFIGRLAWLRKKSNSELGFAFSYYGGGVITPNITGEGAVDRVYSYTKNEGFSPDQAANNVGHVNKREYFGLSGKYNQKWAAGQTKLTAEFLMGSQPGTFKNNNDPGGNSFGNGSDPLYLRQFMGYYVMLVQDIAKSKHSVVLKYDYYDPNTQIKGNEIGKLKGTGAADIAYSTFGLGYLYRLNDNVRLMAYYDFVNNEHSDNLKGYASRIKQNVLTIRAQVKF